MTQHFVIRCFYKHFLSISLEPKFRTNSVNGIKNTLEIQQPFQNKMLHFKQKMQHYFESISCDDI